MILLSVLRRKERPWMMKMERGHSEEPLQMRMLKKMDMKKISLRAFLKTSPYGCHPMLGPAA
jgi:hypothetical protein